MNEHDRPTLAQIQAELRDLKRENGQLREKVAALEARRSAPPVPVLPTPSLARRFPHIDSAHAPQEAPRQQQEARRPSRRGILRAVAGVAAAAAGASALVEAGTGTALADNYGNFSTTTSSIPAVAVSATGAGTYGVQAVTDSGYAVYGYTTTATGYGIYGVNSYGGFAIAADGSNGGGGISARTDYAIGVSAWATTGIAVYAYSPSGQALFAQGGANTASVHAAANGVSTTPNSAPGTCAVFAEGGFGTAIYATSSLGSTAIVATGSSGSSGVVGNSDSGNGLSGNTMDGSGVYAVARGTGTGVTAYGNSGDAVYGQSGSSNGVQAVSNTGTGVYATSTSGEGIFGQGGSGKASIHAAANGVTPGTPPGTAALFAEGGSGYGAVVISTGSNAALTATAGAAGSGIVGSGKIGVSGSGGVGVAGTSAKGYGLYAQGGLAPLYLAPAGTTGHPATGTHHFGEFYVDSNAVLYFCVVSGTPGTWKTVTLT